MWTGHALMHSLFRMMSMSSRLARRNFPSWYFRCAASWFKPSSVFWLNLDVPIRSWDPDFPCPRNPFETPPALEVPPQRPGKDSSMSDETKEGANWLVVLWICCVVREVGMKMKAMAKKIFASQPAQLIAFMWHRRQVANDPCMLACIFHPGWLQSLMVSSGTFFVMIMQDSQSVNQERSRMPNRNMRTSTWKFAVPDWEAPWQRGAISSAIWIHLGGVWRNISHRVSTWNLTRMVLRIGLSDM